jgi:hypothetical protein
VITRNGLAGLLLIASLNAFGQSPPAYLFVNNSSATLVDDASVKALFQEMVSPRLGKLYPAGVWGFATQVHGGFTEDKTCVIAASTMLLPRNPAERHQTDAVQAQADCSRVRRLAERDRRAVRRSRQEQDSRSQPGDAGRAGSELITGVTRGRRVARTACAMAPA